MKHKNPDCGNVEIGEGNCPRCWRDSFTCDDKSHHFAENTDICDCRMLTRRMAESEAFSDSEGYEKWTDCEKHGAVKDIDKFKAVLFEGMKKITAEMMSLNNDLGQFKINYNQNE